MVSFGVQLVQPASSLIKAVENNGSPPMSFSRVFFKLQSLGKPDNYSSQKSQSRLEELQPAQTKPARLLEMVHRGQISDTRWKIDKFNVVSAFLNMFFPQYFVIAAQILQLKGHCHAI